MYSEKKLLCYDVTALNIVQIITTQLNVVYVIL